MCLVLLSFGDHPHLPVLLAGNRDEMLIRPAASPAVMGSSPVIMAGRDLIAGGTWMGRNEHGLMAALTNASNPDWDGRPGARSRGEITLGLLEFTAPGDGAEWLSRLNVGDYLPFSVLFGQAGRFYYFSTLASGEVKELAPGCYILSNSALDDASWPKVARAHHFFATSGRLPAKLLIAALQDFLVAKDVDAEASPSSAEAITQQGARARVFLPSSGYGTVSSSIMTAGGTLGDRYYYAGREALLRAHRGGLIAQKAYRSLPLPFPPAS